MILDMARLVWMYLLSTLMYNIYKWGDEIGSVIIIHKGKLTCVTHVMCIVKHNNIISEMK